MLLVVQVACDRQAFVDAMGGPDKVIQDTTVTVGQLADAMERQLLHLTTPGARVYRRQSNRDKFWCEIIEDLS